MWKLAIYNQKSKMHLSWCTISVSKLIKLEIRVLQLVRACLPVPKFRKPGIRVRAIIKSSFEPCFYFKNKFKK